MSMEANQTEDGRREDLEAIEANPVLSYIGQRFYPVLNVTEKTGSIYYTTLTADGAAQEGVARGTPLALNYLTESVATYSVAPDEKRYGIGRDEVQQMGGIEKADKLGGAASKRSVQRVAETAIALQLQTVGTHQSAAHAPGLFIAEANVAREAIRRYPGKTAFVCAFTTFNAVMRYTEILNQFSLSALMLGGGEAKDVIAGSPAALKMILGGILSVDEVIVGDDEHWGVDIGSSGIGCNGVFVKLPGTEEFSHKMDPVLGKFVQYLPDGTQSYIVESWYNKELKSNIYDAESWNAIAELNAEAAYVLEGLVA